MKWKLHNVVRKIEDGWFQRDNGTLVEGNYEAGETSVVPETNQRPMPSETRHPSILPPPIEEQREMPLPGTPCEPYCEVWYTGTVTKVYKDDDNKKTGKYDVEIINRYRYKLGGGSITLGTKFEGQTKTIWAKDLCYCSQPGAYEGYEVDDIVKIYIRDFNVSCSENFDIESKGNIIEKVS